MLDQKALEDLSNGLFERCRLLTVTVCAYKFSKRVNARYSICMHTPSQILDYINPLLN